MDSKNNKILQEVKNHINDGEKIEEKNDISDEEFLKNMLSEKVDGFNVMIENEIKDWIKKNATKISKDIILRSVRKLFK